MKRKKTIPRLGRTDGISICDCGWRLREGYGGKVLVTTKRVCVRMKNKVCRKCIEE